MESSLLYILLLASSPVFGVEALLLGFGRKALSVFKDRINTMLISSSIGLIVIAPSIAISQIFGLEPIFICVLIFILTISSRIMVPFLVRTRTKEERSLSPERVEEDKIKSILKKRGLSSLIKDKEDKEDKHENENSLQQN